MERVRFHIPGHQGRGLFPSIGISADYLTVDSTEIDGLDDLSAPEGCIADAQHRAARLYGAQHTFFLVQGSTVGIQAALLAAFQPGDTVLVPRNAHRSIIHGMILADLNPVWLMPEYNAHWGTWLGLTAQAVERGITEHPHAKGVILPNPTYDGWVPELAAIGKMCMQHNLKLIADEAHGALFPLHNDFPTSGCQVDGVDIVVQSLHKHAGGITPSAVAHLPKSSAVSPKRFQAALNLLHTSSPPYPLMAAMDNHIGWLNSTNGQHHIAQTLAMVAEWRNSLTLPPHITLCHTPNRDPLSLLLQVTGADPNDWAIWLEDAQGISFEAINPQSALYKVGLGVTPQDLTRFTQALQALGEKDFSTGPLSGHFSPHALPIPHIACSPRHAFFNRSEVVSAQHAVGRVAQHTIAPCPPGIPLLIPGEVIQPGHASFLPDTIAVCETTTEPL